MQNAGVWGGADAMCKCGKQGDAKTSCTKNKNPSSAANAAGCLGTKGKKNVTHVFKDNVGAECSLEAISAGCTSIKSERSKALTKLPKVSTGTTVPTSNYTYKAGNVICIKRNTNLRYADLATVDTNQTDVKKQCPPDTKKCGGICYPTKEGDCPLESFSVQYNAVAGYDISIKKLNSGSGAEPLIDVTVSHGMPW
jgi:hypothetical protein